LKKTRKITLILFSFLVIIYFFLLLFPQVLFRNKIEYKSFVVYSHSQPGRNIFEILDSAQNLLSHTELYENENSKNKIFLCNSFSEYSFFAPTATHAFACNKLFTNNIVVSKSNIIENKVESNSKENNTRTLSGTIAHEVTHTLIKNKLGFVKYLMLDKWKNEGYADFVAKESSFNYLIGMYFLCNSETPSAPSFKYFKYRIYIKYLMEDEKLSFDKIAKRNFNLKNLEKEIRQKSCE